MPRASELLAQSPATVSELRGAIVSSTRAVATVAFVFDDGYRSNFLNALPLFKKYGFAATLAHEIERTGQDYGGNPAYPVCTADDLRQLIRAGWEVCNHPSLNTAATEADMVAAAQAENELLRQFLTGEKVKNYATGVVTDGTLDYPEFSDFAVSSSVYRGGLRNETSDRAYRFLFDKVRSINGAVAERGDHLYAFGRGAEQTTQMSAWPVDTTSNSLSKSLAFIESVAQARATAILYAHDTPIAGGGATPYIQAADLGTLLRRCHELGVQVVPLSKLFVGNAVRDSRFDASTGALSANSGDSCQFSEVDTLNGAARCVEITATQFRGSNSTGYRTDAFVCEPFCRYRVRVRYKIDADLTLNGGAGNRNHGLNVELATGQANTSGFASCNHSSGGTVLNDASARLPYQATSGYDEFSTVLLTGQGAQASVNVAIFQATGTVRIGQIIVEKLHSITDLPISGAGTFAVGGTLVRLPSPNIVNSRRWEWEVSVIHSADEPAWAKRESAASFRVVGPTSGTFRWVARPVEA